MERDAAIIEVGLNEAALRAENPHVPYAPEECADDARRCAEAGAAVVHWHARDPITGAQRLGDVALSGAALDRMRPSGVIAYPSYPPWPVSPDRLEHVWALRERHGLELAPLDLGSVGIVVWDDLAQGFGPGLDLLREHGVVANPLPFILDALERCYSLGMVPTVAAFDVGFTRTMVLLARAGKLRPPIFLKIFLSGAWAVGPFPTEEALDFHLQQIPARARRRVGRRAVRPRGSRTGRGTVSACARAGWRHSPRHRRRPGGVSRCHQRRGRRTCSPMGCRRGPSARFVGRRATALRPADSRLSHVQGVPPACGARGSTEALSARGPVDR